MSTQPAAGQRLLLILAALTQTQDGQERLDEIARGTQPIASLNELGESSGVDIADEVVLLESLTRTLNEVGTEETIRRLTTTSTGLEHLEAEVSALGRLLLAIPECQLARVNDIAANIMEILLPHLGDKPEQALVAYAQNIALKVLEGESCPMPDQLIAGFHETLTSKTRRKK